MDEDQLLAPASSDKPSLLEYLERFLPFSLPRIPLPQTAKNLDKACGKLILAKGTAKSADFKRQSKLKDAQVAAQINLIKVGSGMIQERISSQDSDLAIRAIEAAIGEHVEDQRNREKIVQIAVEDLMQSPPHVEATAEIDDDWLGLFSSIAAKKSREDMQSLWGKVLAGEIRQPGSFKLRTLQALAVLEPAEAKLIHKHMAYVVNDDSLFCGQENSLIQFSTLLELENLDIVRGVGSSFSLDITKSHDTNAYVRMGHRDAIFANSKSEITVNLRKVYPLTSFGREMFQIAEAQSAPADIVHAVAAQFKAEGRTLSLLKLGPRGENGEQVIVETREL
jgi:Protein of unknown function (DUF2806)